MVKKIDNVILFIWVYIVIALPPFLILNLMQLSSTEPDFIMKFVRKIPELPTLIIIAIILPAIGVFLSVLRKKIKIVYFWQLDKQGKIKITFFSLFLSLVLWRFFSVLNKLSYLGLIILFMFFLLYLPLATMYLDSLNFNKLKLLIAPPQQKFTPMIIGNIFFSLIVLLFIHASVIALDGQIRTYTHNQIFISRMPQIYSVEPRLVYHGTKVVVLGKNFGWKVPTQSTKFYTQQGELNIDLWTNSKIIFTVPLQWKPGNIEVWEKTILNWDDKNIDVQSNIAKIKLISVTNSFTPDDDAYFQQLKHLNKETLKINGYK